MSQILPRPNQVVAVTKTGALKADIKPAIEQAFSHEEFISDIEPHITNGGVEGHKLFDQLRMLEMAYPYDTAGLIANSKLTTKDKVDQLSVVLRRHYILDKKGKFVMVNPKRYALLAAPSEA